MSRELTPEQAEMFRKMAEQAEWTRQAIRYDGSFPIGGDEHLLGTPIPVFDVEELKARLEKILEDLDNE